MCERAKDEPLIQYWFRQFKEEPLRVCILFTTGAMVWLYQDGNRQWEQYREDMWEQQKQLVELISMNKDALYKVEGRLSSCETSLHHLEREHEHARNKNDNKRD